MSKTTILLSFDLEKGGELSATQINCKTDREQTRLEAILDVVISGLTAKGVKNATEA